MSLAWLIVALAAAAVQTLRFALQKRLKGAGLSSGGATFSRFLFGAPVAVITTLAVLLITDSPLPSVTPGFFAFAVLGGLCQIAATMATVALFSERDFAVGIAFTKSETLMVALVSLVLLGETVSALALAALALGMIGVLLLSWKPGAGRVAFANRATALGLAAGLLFAVSAVGYRGATLAVEAATPLLRASLTLAAVTLFQSAAMSLYLRLFDPGEVTRVLTRWRETALVGLAGVAGSLGWFIAFALQSATYVRAVGQIELVFSLLVSWLVFGERTNKRELLGIALLGAAIVALVLTL